MVIKGYYYVFLMCIFFVVFYVLLYLLLVIELIILAFIKQVQLYLTPHLSAIPYQSVVCAYNIHPLKSSYCQFMFIFWFPLLFSALPRWLL